MTSLNLLAAGAALSLILSSAAGAAPSSSGHGSSKEDSNGEPRPSYAAVPAWVRSESVPAPDPARKDSPFQFLLSNSQERITASGVENFVDYVVEPQNLAGVQAIGTIVIPWNVNRSGLVLNRVEIEREGKPIDALRREDVSVIRREGNLEKSMLTGVRSVVLPVRDLRVGDRLRVSFTYKARPSIGTVEEVQNFDFPFPVRRAVRRMLVDKALPVRWSVAKGVKELREQPPAGFVERDFVGENLEPAKERKYVPDRFKSKLIQVTTYGSWQDVADALTPLFAEARKIGPDSPVATLASSIAAAHPDKEGRMLAALRTVQDKVRYVGLLLGDADYKPMSADEVWSRRFGDCKGKTALILALLDRLGIEAEPMLASVSFDDGLETRLPTLAMFDHIFVRAHLGDDVYYLDGTNFGQRTLEELRQSPTRHGLPLTGNTTLVTTPDVLPSKPLQDTLLVWDASEGVTGKVPFVATLTLRGSTAAQMRAKTISSTDNDALADSLKSKVPGVPNDALELVSTETDAPDGSYIAHFKGNYEIDWSPVEGLKGNRMQLSQSTVTWNEDFDREDGEGKDLPVLMAYPYWERSTEKVILPDGGKGFRLEAEPIDRTVAVTHISRTVSMAGGTVVAVNDFERLKRELNSDDARSAKAVLDAISGNYAYIVSKRKLKTPR